MMIKLRNLSKKYGTRTILDNLHLRLPAKGLVAVVGPSGCGKTTLLNILAGLDVECEGEYLFDRTSIGELTEEQRDLFRLSEIGYVFQDFRLFDSESIYDNLALPLATLARASPQIRRQRILDVLEVVGLEHLLKRKVNRLSGGEKQRVAIARAIINDPRVVLCDEPTGALDEKTGLAIFELLKAIAGDALVIVVTHDEKLADSFCTRKILLKDGRAIGDTSQRQSALSKRSALIKANPRQRRPRMPISTMIRRGVSILKAKKIRLIITNSVMSFGLLGIGMSIIMSTSLQGRITEGFSAVIDDRRIVMSLASQNQQIENAYSAAFDKVVSIASKYSSLISDAGASYAVNFENFFKDRDELFISSTAHKIVLPRFSTRQINDYRWLDEQPSVSPVYPLHLDDLENDEVVVGLPYNDMVGLCYSLHIERNYPSLGEHLRKTDILMTLGIANHDWYYEDEQLFRFAGVIETAEPTLFHTLHRWNEWVFEEKMRIPSIDSENRKIPWEVTKTYYLKANGDPELFLAAAFKDPDLDDCVFEIANEIYHPTMCSLGVPCLLDRILVFDVDKQAIGSGDIKKVLSEERRLSFPIFASDAGYYYHPDSFLAGFAHDLFFSLSRDQLEKVVDADIYADGDTHGVGIDLPSGVLQGSLLSSLSGGVAFSSELDRIIRGRPPNSLDEIVVSQGFAETLVNSAEIIGQNLQIATAYREIASDDGHVEKLYSFDEVTIVGVAEGHKAVIHHESFWSVGYFQIKVGISAFSLVVRHVIFEMEEAVQSDDIIDHLSSRFPRYTFANPIRDMAEGIDEAMSFLQISLLAFSGLSILISIFLFIIVMQITIEENRKDINLMHCLGVSFRDIKLSFSIYALLMSTLSCLVSGIGIVICDYFISYVIAGYVGTNVAFHLNLSPLLATSSSASLIALFSSRIAMVKYREKGAAAGGFCREILKKV